MPDPGRFPEWIRRRVREDEDFSGRVDLLRRLGLGTVCEGANCPNIHECFHRGAVTFMILGSTCTRSCAFCSVRKGSPPAPDWEEPDRVARAVSELGLRYAVVTSPTRDDLPDGGAEWFARTVYAVRALGKGVGVEVLVPDFGGYAGAVQRVLDSGPDVFAHNLETVPSRYPEVRPRADYRRSLAVLAQAADNPPPPRGPVVKSGLMLGLGETRDEVVPVMRDLREAGCRALTLGQYLKPDRTGLPVKRFLPPEEFDELAALARKMGFAHVASGVFVRSSYLAERCHAALRSPC